MYEVFPVVMGLVIGVGCSRINRRALRLSLCSALVLLYGFAATMISGEYLLSWAFLLIDVGLVAVVAAVGMVAGRAVRSPSAAPRRGAVAR